MDPRQLIRTFILENFLFTTDESALEDDASFLILGIIDSVGALEIVLFLEDSFGIQVQENEMLPSNLDSVNNLVAFFQSKQKGIDHVKNAPAALVAGLPGAHSPGLSRPDGHRLGQQPDFLRGAVA